MRLIALNFFQNNFYFLKKQEGTNWKNLTKVAKRTLHINFKKTKIDG